ncbi:hypothetical protein ACIGZJ_19000 [Kitasatospora sp. NPDC052868]|uniref:hypothetical protein n=1 Tax=Kitasatospora sp. NPDC052868 TaxID=3364060 RepID=UPI0037C69A7B
MGEQNPVRGTEGVEGVKGPERATDGTGGTGATGGAGDKPTPKARLVFRDPLDQQSRDDTDSGWGDRPGAGQSGARGLDWYLSQRPPHHGG